MEINELIKFEVTAPAKVILHGEHSVVYGKPAVTSAVGIRNSLTFSENISKEIVMDYKSLTIIKRMSLDKVNENLRSLFEDNTSSELDHEELLKLVKSLVETSLLQNEDTKDSHIKKTLISTFYCLYGIFFEMKLMSLRHGFSVCITSQAPLGAGLGSSASFAVCLSTAMYLIAKNEHETLNEYKSLSIEDKNFISKWAFFSEKLMHGNPSGIDNYICTFGGFVNFTKGKPITEIKSGFKLNILLVNSMVERNTAKEVRKVANLKKDFPEIVDNIMNAIESVTNESIPLYKEPILTERVYDQLKTLYRINHTLLNSLGVSHETLEFILSIVGKYNFSGKLTGAGGGGYFIILLPDDYESQPNFVKLCEELNDNKFDWILTTVGESGVQVKIF